MGISCDYTHFGGIPQIQSLAVRAIGNQGIQTAIDKATPYKRRTDITNLDGVRKWAKGNTTA